MAMVVGDESAGGQEASPRKPKPLTLNLCPASSLDPPLSTLTSVASPIYSHLFTLNWAGHEEQESEVSPRRGEWGAAWRNETATEGVWAGREACDCCLNLFSSPLLSVRFLEGP